MRIRYIRYNEKAVWRVVVVPTEAEEDERRVYREYLRLSEERSRHMNRIRSLLALHGVWIRGIKGIDFSRLRDWRGRPLPPAVQEELRREQERMGLIEKQIKTLRAQWRKGIREPKTAAERKAAQLTRLRGIGVHGASLLWQEMFGGRKFRNRREVGALAGLTGTAYARGEKVVEQGISKAGNRRVRTMMIELAWIWTRHQRGSELSRWFERRFGSGGKRARRVGIVALARKLLVALWKYVEFDEVPAGAIVAA